MTAVERSVAGVRLGNLGRCLGEVGWYAAGSGAGYPGAADRRARKAIPSLTSSVLSNAAKLRDRYRWWLDSWDPGRNVAENRAWASDDEDLYT